MSRNPDPAVYALAFDQSQRSLARQEASLDELRSRTATLVSAAAIALSFLGGSAASGGFSLAGQLGIVAFVVLATLAVVILLPFRVWVFDDKVDALFATYIEADDPADIVQMHRDLALHHANHIADNETLLNRLYWAFRVAAGLLVVEVVLMLVNLAR
jgi:hypothetical protein